MEFLASMEFHESMEAMELSDSASVIRDALGQIVDLTAWEPGAAGSGDVTAVALAKGRRAALAIAIKTTARATRDLLEGYVARWAILARDAGPAKRGALATVPTLALLVPHLGTLRLPELDAFLGEDLAAKRHLVVISQRGGRIVALPKLGVRVERPDDAAPASSAPARSAGLSLTSDVAQWALKVLLANVAKQDRRTWGGPTRADRLGNPGDLAELAGIGSSTAYAVVDALRERRWVATPRRGAFDVIDLRGMLRWWLDVAKHERPRLVPMQPVYDRLGRDLPAALRWLRDTRADGVRWAVGGWAAVAEHDASHVVNIESQPVLLHTSAPLAELERSFRLSRASDAGTAPVLVQVTSGARSVLGGVVGADRLPVVDLWQAALDVAGDPQRGIEQAESIAERLAGEAP